MLTPSHMLRFQVSERPHPQVDGRAGAIPVSDLDLRLSRFGRGERLITWSRVALSTFSLAAVWLDPAEPARWTLIAYSLLLAYVICAVILALLFSSVATSPPRLGIVAHVLDLGVAIAINALTGAGSPFFLLFVFVLVAATLRWQWRGALTTGLAVLLAHVLLSVFGLQTGGAGFELNRFIIRGSYLAWVAVLLGFLGTWEARLRRDLVDLADTPRNKGVTFEEAAGNWLAHAATVLRSTRLMLAWEDTEEPWLDTLLWKEGDLRRERHDPGALSPLVAEPLRAASFLCLDLTSPTPTALYTSERGGLAVWRGHPVHPEILRRVPAHNVLSLPVIGEGVNARLFAFDKAQLTSDDLVVGVILGRQIVGALEQQTLIRETRHSAANEERIRLARELHDGIAQSLTGAALSIGGLRRTLASDPASASARLDEIEELLVNEQRELRLFMQELRPTSADSDQSTLRIRLEELCHRASSLWSVEVGYEVIGEIGPQVSWDVYRLAQEALVNAARHAQATSIRITVSVRPYTIAIRVADNGHGFPFHGVYDLATLNARKIGPLSLKERIGTLRGNLILESSDEGTVLDISLPLA